MPLKQKWVDPSGVERVRPERMVEEYFSNITDTRRQQSVKGSMTIRLVFNDVSPDEWQSKH